MIGVKYSVSYNRV